MKLKFKFFVFFILASWIKLFGMFAGEVPVPVKFQNQLTQNAQPMEDVDETSVSDLQDEFETDEDGDVFMAEASPTVPEKVISQNQSANPFGTQEKLMRCINWLKDVNVSEEYKKNLIRHLLENLGQISQSSLSGWFLCKLKENGLEEVWKIVLGNLLKLQIQSY